MCECRLCSGCGVCGRLGGVLDASRGGVSRLMRGGLLLKPTHLDEELELDDDMILATAPATGPVGDDDMTEGVEDALDAAIGTSSSVSSSSVSVKSIKHTSLSSSLLSFTAELLSSTELTLGFSGESGKPRQHKFHLGLYFDNLKKMTENHMAQTVKASI